MGDKNILEFTENTFTFGETYDALLGVWGE